MAWVVGYGLSIPFIVCDCCCCSEFYYCVTVWFLQNVSLHVAGTHHLILLAGYHFVEIIGNPIEHLRQLQCL